MTRVILFGTCDMGKPRSRIMVAAARSAGIEVIELRYPLWEGIEDKSQLHGRLAKLGLVLRAALITPWLLLRYLFAPRHDAVWIGYPGPWEVLLLWPLAKLRRKPIVWDMFISLYDTIVRDRTLTPPTSLKAKLLFALERTAMRAADRVTLDTQTHAHAIADLFRIPREKVAHVFVGAEPEHFHPLPEKPMGDVVQVLFYGQCIPLHGMETIVEAAAGCGNDFHFRLIGTGQEADKIAARIEELGLNNIDWTPWVPYPTLRDEMARADVVLGIFGDSEKAANVIPNKVFQALACNKPIITRDSPAIRELVEPNTPEIALVPPADYAALLAALHRFRSDRLSIRFSIHDQIRSQISPNRLGESWLAPLSHGN